MDILKDIKIDAKAFYLSDKSSANKSLYFFMYEVNILNQSNKIIQLINRYWEISDANENVQIVEGKGVIGKQPILKPNTSFKYNSFCPIKTEFGKMSGYYTFKEENTDNLYKGIIPEFILISPTHIN